MRGVVGNGEEEAGLRVVVSHEGGVSEAEGLERAAEDTEDVDTSGVGTEEGSGEVGQRVEEGGPLGTET